MRERIEHSVRSLNKIKRKKGSEGLTLIECLVAIAMVGISSALVGPMMMLALATRIQSQRAEQAFLLAQQEIDSIRIEIEQGGDYTTFLAAYPVTPESETDIADTVAPTKVDAALDSNDVKVAKAVDIDADTEDADPEDEEFAVQVFRTAGVDSRSDTTQKAAFKVGVRVYDNRALQQNSGSMLTDAASLTLTSGEGQRSLRPLAVLYTDIIKSDQELSLCDYRQYIDSTASETGLDCG